MNWWNDPAVSDGAARGFLRGGFFGGLVGAVPLIAVQRWGYVAVFLSMAIIGGLGIMKDYP